VISAQTAANVEAVSAGHHDVEKEESGRLAFSVGDNVCGGVKQAHIEASCFQVMLHQPRDIGVVFQHKYSLAQTVCPSFTPRTKTYPWGPRPRPAAVESGIAWATRNH
jgi:hypothetical protein